VTEEQKTIDPSWESAKLSIKLSILLSTIYAILGVFIFFLTQGEIKIIPIALVAGSPLIVLVAIFPSIIIGFMTGRIIYAVAESKFTNFFSRVSFAFTSMLICGLIALLIYTFFGIKIDLSFEAPINYLSFGFLQTYPFVLGMPTIIYILAGGWFGWNIYSKNISS